MKYPIAIILLITAGCGRAPRTVESTASAPTVSGSRVRLAAGSPQLSQIQTTTVTTLTVPQDLVTAPGKIQFNPNRISRVAMPVAGRIAAMEVRLGDAVHKGQPLFRIESPEMEAAQSDCQRADATKMQARAEMAKSRADLQRQRDLFDHGAVPKKDVLEAEADATRAEASMKEAQAAVEQARRRLTILGLRPCEYGQQVIVRAPISGKVLEIAAVPGEYRNDTSTALLTVADLSSVWVTSDVPEGSIRMIQRGERVQIDLAAYPGEEFHGTVRRVGDTVNPVTRTVEVQAELDNTAGRFRPEMYARIRHSHSTRTVPAVPAAAIVQSAGRAWLFLERTPGEFERTAVDTGESAGPSVPVLNGLAPSDRVVSSGAVLLNGILGGAR